MIMRILPENIFLRLFCQGFKLKVDLFSLNHDNASARTSKIAMRTTLVVGSKLFFTHFLLIQAFIFGCSTFHQQKCNYAEAELLVTQRKVSLNFKRNFTFLKS